MFGVKNVGQKINKLILLLKKDSFNSVILKSGSQDPFSFRVSTLIKLTYLWFSNDPEDID